ncbi:hypothetical protein NDI45_25130 [Leptolyngbya sp. GB1-A1]|uniref:hypothetical protein n=1 Tax=Leptolyngbya sp. GB1-A1 TaxID=2933908 RepID=UPI003298E87D
MTIAGSCATATAPRYAQERSDKRSFHAAASGGSLVAAPLYLLRSNCFTLLLVIDRIALRHSCSGQADRPALWAGAQRQAIGLLGERVQGTARIYAPTRLI